MIKSAVLKVIASTLSGSYNHLVRASNNPVEEQRKVLARILGENRDSNFGKKHGFGNINSIGEFQENVPLGDYDSLYPWIEREMKGEVGQLTSRPVEMFVTTSGTTSSYKFIPVTKDYINAYKSGMGAWITSAFRDHPGIAGKVLTIASPKVEGFTESGIPFGAVSGLMHEKQSRVSKHFYVPNDGLFTIEDPDVRKHYLARIALANRVTHIHTANPLTIVNLCKTIEQNSDKLIRDIYDGVVSIGAGKELRVQRDVKRVRELENLLKRGEFSPEHFWDIALIGCWTGGTQSLFLEQFPKYFGDAPVRDIGLLASEGRMSIPLGDRTPSGVLDIANYFYEFIPEEEIGEKNPDILTVEKLKNGEDYFMVITSPSGLYRYDIRDLVNVTGFYNNTPEIAFLNKGKHISSIVGEKLSEHQVVQAYRESKSEGMPDKFIVYPKVEGGDVRYMFVSSQDVDCDFARKFDDALRHTNVEYDSKRKTNRLGSVNLETIPEREFEIISRRNGHPGKETQFKHIYLRGLNFL